MEDNLEFIKAAERFSKDLEKYPVEVQIGVALGITNLANGCSWVFLTNPDKEFLQNVDAINKNKNMKCIKLTGGYLFYIDIDYLLSILRTVRTSGFVSKEVLTIAVKHRQKALAQLEKYMDKNKSGKIGIFNVNDTPNVTVSGVRYDAFCVTLMELLVMCVKKNYKVVLGGKPRNPSDVQKRIVDILPRLEVAPSGNALFIEMCK